MGCYVVLGVQWLKQLGPIVWDFSALTMQFTMEGQKVILQGMVFEGVQMAIKKQLAKMSYSNKRAYTLLMTIATKLTATVSTTSQKSVPDDLQQLLDYYKVLFEVPKGLPPPREYDHKIPFVDELQVVNMRPYRYPSI